MTVLTNLRSMLEPSKDARTEVGSLKLAQSPVLNVETWTWAV